MSHTQSFTRPTILAAVELLGVRLTQAQFDQMVLRVELERAIRSGKEMSTTAKAVQMASLVVQYGSNVIDTTEGSMTRTEAVVREAVKLVPISSPEQHDAFLRGLARDGYVVDMDDATRRPWLRAALPEEIDLPATDDEVQQLLKHFNFSTPRGHLAQAIDAHARGDWAAANAQMRTFLESLFDDIARYALPQEAAQCHTSENRRALLANREFLSVRRNEWTPEGKSYINGLFKMLHSEGSHPGLSDEDHCTFRLHLVLITARTFLRRLHNRQ